MNWSSEKNLLLQRERGVSFEEALAAIAHGGLLDVVQHPNKQKFPTQRIFIVRIRGYAYLVPFVETEKEIFLKTVSPSRVATRTYINDQRNT